MLERRALIPAALAAAMTVLGCGGSSGETAQNPVKAVPSSIRSAVASAQDVDPGAFPKPQPGQSLEAFSSQFETNGPQAVAATSVFRPPSNRLAFGLLDG